MYLTRHEERIYRGDFGETLARALRVIVKVGESMGARKLINISHAHISGVGYSNIGDAGLEFLRDLVKEKLFFKVYTTANPGSVNVESVKYFSYSKEFIDKQLEILDIYRSLGVDVFTCAPYHVRTPRYGEHLSWAESNAILVANSLYGARTNKEAGVLALFSALTGKTYYAGLHITRERYPRVVINVKNPRREYTYLGLLGLYIGRLVGDKVPYIRGLGKLDIERIKTLLAAIGTTGSVGMSIIENISPEEPDILSKHTKYIEDRIEVEDKDIKFFEESSRELCDDPEVFIIGCPHVSPEFLLELRELLAKVDPKPKKPIWLFTPPIYSNISYLREILDELSRKGIYVIKSVCPVTSPLSELGYRCVGTTSSKALFYLPKLAKTRVALMDLQDIVRKVYEVGS
ncbi:MAG: aconitase X catalytic domain-containing protein [Sulfolobales archaeon]